MVDLCRELAEQSMVSNIAKSESNDGAVMGTQAAGLLSQQNKPSSWNKNSQNSKRGGLNKSTDSVKKQGLRCRTRSLDHVKTSAVKDVYAKNVKRSDVKAGRARSQSGEREENHKSSSSATRSQTRMKLTIPHTPQLLK